jgi:hypothetical protein
MIWITDRREKKTLVAVLRIRVFVYLQLRAMPLKLLVKFFSFIEETGFSYRSKEKYIHE